MALAAPPSFAAAPSSTGRSTSSGARLYLLALLWVFRGPPGRFARPRRLGPCAAAAVGGGAFVCGARRSV
eukprot:6325968-Alexandrium_andersonii.AAC.1